MSRNRFVDNEVVRLPLTDGDWVEIKKELGVSEKKKLEGAPLQSARKDQQNGDEVEMGLSWERYYVMKLELYLVDWSLRDKDGKPVRVSKEAIASLRESDADEILEAIKAHEESLENEAKNRTGATVLATSS